MQARVEVAGRSSEARHLFATALEGHRKVGDRLGEAETLTAWGFSLHSDGEDAKARPLFEESCALAVSLGATLEITKSREGLALCAGRAGLSGEAVELLDQCIEAYRLMGLANDEERAALRRAQFISRSEQGVDEPRIP